MKPTLVRLITTFKGDTVTLTGKRRGARGRYVTQAVQQVGREDLRSIMNSPKFRTDFLIKQSGIQDELPY